MGAAAPYIPAAIGALGAVAAARQNSTSQTSSSAEPWRFLAPYLAGGNRVGVSQEGKPPVKGLYDLSYEQAMRPLGSAYQFGPESIAARSALWGATRTPSNLERGAYDQLYRTTSGDYLYGGPGFNAAYKAAARQVIPQVSSMFSGGGRLNSGLARTAMTQGLADAFAGLYNSERARQTSAAAQYPSIQQGTLQRLAVPVSIGESADLARRQQAFEPQQRLGWLGQQYGTVATGVGQNVTSPAPQSSMMASLLGGAMLGNSLYNAWSGPGASSSAPMWGGGNANFTAGPFEQSEYNVFGF